MNIVYTVYTVEKYFVLVCFGLSAVTCVYALLPGKSQNIYEGFLRAVVERCEELGYSPDPCSILFIKGFENIMENRRELIYEYCVYSVYC